MINDRPREHRLKTWPVLFSEVRSGNKPFEVRKNDRDFKVGDFLFLEEWDPTDNKYTGEYESFIVTYILDGGQFGIDPDHCVMGISKQIRA